MKDKLRITVKSYGLYAVLATALLISAAVSANLSKTEKKAVIIYQSSSNSDSESKALTESSSKTEKATKITTTKQLKVKVTTTKKPKETTVKTSKVTTSKTAKSTKAVSVKETEEMIEIVFPIDINRVTFEELTAIDGIGEVTANEILDYRASVGKIGYMEQLLEIHGIGESTVALLSQYLYVDAADEYTPTVTQVITTTTKRSEITTTTKNTELTITTTAPQSTLPPETQNTVSETTTVGPITFTETEPPEIQYIDINEADAEELMEKLLIDEELANSIIETRESLGGKYESYLQLLYVNGVSKEQLAEWKEHIII